MRSRDPSSSSVVGGHVAPGFEVVREAFEENFAREGEVGAAFAAWVDGVPAVDLWAGLADRRRGMPWGEDTLVGVFSGTKGLVATCLLLLLERQLLDLDAPVCRYWPEFGAAGKEGLLVRDLVSHQAGLPGLLTPVTIEGATDDVRISQLLADQAPITTPPDGPIYHALTFGWLCGALIRHLDGRTVGRFLAEEVAAPLGLEVWIGLPDRQEQRVAVIERSDAFERKRDDVAGSADEVAWTIWGNPPRFAGADLAANSRAWHAAEVPATNGIVSVRSQARLYGCLARGGEIDGVRLVSEPTVTAARRCLSRGYDHTSKPRSRSGPGFSSKPAKPRSGRRPTRLATPVPAVRSMAPGRACEPASPMGPTCWAASARRTHAPNRCSLHCTPRSGQPSAIRSRHRRRFRNDATSPTSQSGARRDTRRLDGPG